MAEDRAKSQKSRSNREETKNAQQRSAGELHEMMTRITSVMRGDLGDQISSLRDDIVPKVGDAAILAREAKRLAENAVVAAATAGGRSDGGSVAIDARGIGDDVREDGADGIEAARLLAKGQHQLGGPQ